MIIKTYGGCVKNLINKTMSIKDLFEKNGNLNHVLEELDNC